MQSDPGAVLCTQDKTFEIRQVQSSNNLYILRPSQHEIEHKVELSAIAQCNGLLELIFKRSDVSQYLRSKLPIYDTSYATENLKAGAGLKDVFMDSPFSIAEIRDGLKELCVFQHDGICWMPSARVVKEIWLAFMNSMTLEGISINKDLDTSHARRLISEDGHNLKIFDAIMKHVCNCDGPYDQASINSSKCIPWIGLVLLETNGESSIQKGTFVSDWRDHLPEAWRPEADLQLLQVLPINVDGIELYADASIRISTLKLRKVRLCSNLEQPRTVRSIRTSSRLVLLNQNGTKDSRVANRPGVFRATSSSLL